ncbi:hypothetical protein MYCTH_2061596 [Thermothelomyces thermophilus ATCC 42464]|uniref:MaoC-like domain-containing protein n=1 Tax=Thermothelomyces thermophilus (strain ATCC 42464 / BCRC 31852 / DSM 1799) TaxID=573729 RepID=G2QC42_THET4|nr:uncharacterized protein MYCTH_2061596 [Thermothelomyces thermophilus ATCC 42464]AEO58071.1 hypothetical protein MYCTH_2061596 [Thermothelomyces thermophilus ATCC 42464]
MRASMLSAPLRRHRPSNLGYLRPIFSRAFFFSSSSSSSISLSTSSSSSSSASAPFDLEAYLQSARQKLTSRPPTLIPDVLSPTHSHLLTLSLADHVPALFPADQLSRPLFPLPSPSSPPSSPKKDEEDLTLPQGHHLVYFPLQLPPSRLLPDGTDPDHCPGAPFVRRMWAGGEVVFREGWDRAMRTDGRRALCVETVGAPVLKRGHAGATGTGTDSGTGQEKVFVDVRRLYGAGEEECAEMLRSGTAPVEEIRRLVFMRGRDSRAGEAAVARRILKASAAPEFTFSLKPDATLLFHFSALTYNAHSIHLDPGYARNREGYKGLLVHGPLSLVLMLSALRACLAKLSPWPRTGAHGQPRPGYVKSLSYRNIAPLYVDEQMTVCLRRTKSAAGELGWDVWIEGPDGGLAVKGKAITTDIAS